MVIEQVAHPGSTFMVLIAQGDPTDEERLLMAARVHGIHQARLAFIPRPKELMPAEKVEQPTKELTGFAALENASVGSYAEAINAAMQTSQEPKPKITVLAGETPLQAARRIANERSSQS